MSMGVSVAPFYIGSIAIIIFRAPQYKTPTMGTNTFPGQIPKFKSTTIEPLIWELFTHLATLNGLKYKKNTF